MFFKGFIDAFIASDLIARDLNLEVILKSVSSISKVIKIFKY